jgi:hypothetical protein
MANSKQQQRRHGAIAPVIRLVMLPDARESEAAPAFLPDASVSDVFVFVFVKTSTSFFRQLLTIGRRARLFEPFFRREQPM